MNSAADKSIDDTLLEFASPTPRQPWEEFPVSRLAHHGAACCESARDWIVLMDFAQLNGSCMTSGPRWLRERYEWGPSPWPVHWCEIVDRKTIDCGAHSALAHEAFKARGLAAYRAQFIQRYSIEAIQQWRLKWRDAGISDYWLAEGMIYHEGNAILLATGELKLWDSSAGWWIEPGSRTGYGSVAAVRVFSETPGDTKTVAWGKHSIRFDRWTYFDGGEAETGDETAPPLIRHAAASQPDRGDLILARG